MNNFERSSLKRSVSSRFVFSGLLVLACLFVASIFIKNIGFFHDDAYITLRYAKNFVMGHGIVWNSDEYVQGYTNFLHLVLSAMLLFLDVEAKSAVRAINASFYFSIIFVTAFYAISREGSKQLFWMFPVLMVAMSVPLVVWVLGGLEAVPFAGLLLGAAILAIMFIDAEDGFGKLFLSGVLFGFGFLMRPDAAVPIVFSGIFFCILFVRKKINFFMLMSHVIGVALICIAYVFWQLYYYGSVMPNTYHAKANVPFFLKLENGTEYVKGFLFEPPFLLFWMGLSLVYCVLLKKIDSKVLYLLSLVLPFLLYVVLLAGGDHMPSYRLLVPIIPLICIILYLVVPEGVRRNPKKIVLVSTLFVGLSSLQVLSQDLNPVREDTASFLGTTVGKYIKSAWREGALIALHTAGSTPFFAFSNRYVDMLGLNDPVIAKRKIESIVLPWQRAPGHSKGDADYVLSRRPDYIILGPAWGTYSDDPYFLTDYELNKRLDFHEAYESQYVFLNPMGQPVNESEALVKFVFYQLKK